MPRNGSGVFSLPPGSTIANGDVSDATDINTPLADIAADARTNLGVTAATDTTTLSTTQTVTGDKTFSGTLTVEGNNTFSAVNTFTVAPRVETLNDFLQMKETDGGVDAKAWQLRGAAGDLSLDTLNDDYTDQTLGVYQFERDGNLNVGGSVVTRANGDARYAQLGANNTFGGFVEVENTAPYFVVTETDQAVDAKSWQIGGLGSDFVFSTRTDAGAFAAIIAKVDRDGGLANTTSIVTRATGDARYAQLGAANTFTAAQVIDGGSLTVNAASTMLRFYETDAALDEKIWDFRGSAGDLALDIRQDNGTAITLGHYIFERDGNLNANRSVVVREEGDARYEAKSFALSAQSTTTGGTAIDFTSIPAGVNEINVMLDGVSLSGTDNFLVQIGDSGGIETTGYDSVSQQGTTSNSSTAGFVGINVDAAEEITGVMTLRRMAGNKWVGTHNFFRGAGVNAVYGVGIKTLSAELDRVRVTRAGSNTFDANGGISINYR